MEYNTSLLFPTLEIPMPLSRALELWEILGWKGDNVFSKIIPS